MSYVEKTIEVEAPLSTVYNQWTQFEEFPRFMEGVKQVTQLDDTHLKWRAQIGTKEEEWTADIYKQLPDECIAWRSTSGAKNGGEVRFDKLSQDKTKITLKIDYDPDGMVENVGDKLGFVSRRVEGDLQRFKEFIENRNQETGAWRGSVEKGQPAQ